MSQQNPLIFDRKKIKQQRQRGMKQSGDHNFLIDWASKQLISRLDVVKRDFSSVLQVGCRTPLPLENVDHIVTVDLAGTPMVCADEELLPFANDSFDLIFSALNLHTTNDLPGTMLQLKRALKPDGLFHVALLGGETLHELRDAFTKAEMEINGGMSPRVAPFADMQQAGSLMQRAGFSLPVVDSEIVTVTYEHLFKLMHDLRFMGEGNALLDRSKSFNNRKLMMRAAEIYQETYTEEDGRIPATFEVIFMSGWSPHENQQKPLKPGSAKVRLSEALDTQEISTDEKATP